MVYALPGPAYPGSPVISKPVEGTSGVIPGSVGSHIANQRLYLRHG
jgi:hypothetical protein